jgi:hypothetical protein
MRPYFAYCAFLHALLHAVFSTFYRIFLSQYVNELCKASGFKQYALGFPALIAYGLQPKLLVENNGVEPLTSCVQGRRSSQLS